MPEKSLEKLSEIPVVIRTHEPDVLGTIAMATQLETRPDTLLYKDTSACCEDCPDVNDNPPDRSECPYFEFETEKRWPVCTREGNNDDQLNRFFFS